MPENTAPHDLAQPAERPDFLYDVPRHDDPEEKLSMIYRLAVVGVAACETNNNIKNLSDALEGVFEQIARLADAAIPQMWDLKADLRRLGATDADQ